MCTTPPLPANDCAKRWERLCKQLWYFATFIMSMRGTKNYSFFLKKIRGCQIWLWYHCKHVHAQCAPFIAPYLSNLTYVLLKDSRCYSLSGIMFLNNDLKTFAIPKKFLPQSFQEQAIELQISSNWVKVSLIIMCAMYTVQFACIWPASALAGPLALYAL